MFTYACSNRKRRLRRLRSEKTWSGGTRLAKRWFYCLIWSRRFIGQFDFSFECSLHYGYIRHILSYIQCFLKHAIFVYRPVNRKNKTGVTGLISSCICISHFLLRIIYHALCTSQNYDRDRFLETHTADERGKIMAYRRRAKDEEKRERQRRKELLEERFQEEKIESFVKQWELTTEERAKQMAVKCRQVDLFCS